MTIHKNTWIKAGLTLSAAGLFLMTPDSEASASQKWVPRTVLEIERDITDAKESMNTNEKPLEYSVKWGDTLWGVSEATNITVDKLAKVNEIDNPNLILAGSTVYVTDDLSVVSVQNGEDVVSYDVSTDEVKETETPEDVEKVKENKQAEQTEQQAEEEASDQAAAEQQAEEEEAAAQAEQTEQQAEEEASAQAAAEQQAEEEAAAQAAAEQQAEEEAAAQAAAEQRAEEEASAQAAAEQQAEAEQRAEEEAAAQAAAEQQAEEEAAAQAAAEQQAEAEQEAATEEATGQWMSVEATAYSRNQPSLSNFTFAGIDLRENSRVIAVDPDVIPLGSEVYIPGYGEYVAGDTGGAINGNRIDLHMESVSDALIFGRQQLDIQILD